MGTFIENVKRELAFKGLTNKRQAAGAWLQSKLVQMSRHRLLRDYKGNRTSSAGIGSMYFFGYDPKHKATLPYYDKFPLVFPIEQYSDGFLGLNLHYLDFSSRALLMDRLIEVSNNKLYDESTKLSISYGVISSMKKYKMAIPCIKRYLSDHVETKFISIPPDEWKIAIYIPVHDFQKASATQVWSESRSKF